MLRLSFCFAACILAVGPSLSFAADPEKEEPGEWVQLFNGKNLDGWIPKIRYHELGENFQNTVRVENGILKVSYDQYKNYNAEAGPLFEHLFYKEPFSHYRMRVEYRFVGEQCPGGPGWALRNSGVMIHGELPASMAKDQDFPASIEVQLLGGNGTAARPTANLCTPGTNVVMNGKLFLPHCTNSKSETYHGDQWVTCELEVRGNKIVRHYVNGKPVLEYSEPQLDERDPHAKELAKKAGGIQLSGGSISLQSESHPMEFRKVEIKKLKE